MTRGKRLLGLGLAGAVLVSGALWARRQWDPARFRAFPRLRLEGWVADHPDDADALYELGRRYRQEGQLTDARQALERAARLEPGNARLLSDLGELYAAGGDYPRAQALFEQAVRLRPDLSRPHRSLGDLAGISRNYALAIQHYRQALALRPDDVRALTSLGSAYADSLNRGEADYGRGLVYLRRKDYPHAIAALEAAIQRDGGGEDARYRLVRAYFAAGQTAKGQGMLKQFERFKQTEPETRRLSYRLALQPG